MNTCSTQNEPPIFVFCFKVLADKVHIKALTIAQRVGLLQQGLHDTSGSHEFCVSVSEMNTCILTNFQSSIFRYLLMLFVLIMLIKISQLAVIVFHYELICWLFS